MENTQSYIEDESNLLKFDKRVMLISIKERLKFIMITSFIVVLLVAVIVKVFIPTIWLSKCTLIKQSKNMMNNSQLPYLYQQINIETVKETVVLRKNLEEIIDSLKLDLTPPQLKGTVSVTQDKNSKLLHFTATHEDKEVSVNLANTFAEVFLDNYVEMLNSSAKKMRDYYFKQREYFSAELLKAYTELRKFQDYHNIISIDAETDIRYAQIREFETKMLEDQLTISGLKVKIEKIEAVLDTLPARLLQDQKNNELSLLKSKYTDDNPKVKNAQKEFNLLKKKINKKDGSVGYANDFVVSHLRLQKREFEYKLASFNANIDKYVDKINMLKIKLKDVADLKHSYNKLTQKVEMAQRRLELIEGRLLETKIALESNIGDFEILQYAVPPKYPSNSNRKMIVVVVAILTFGGLLMGFIIKDLLNFTVKSDFDFKQILEIKLLGEIPNKDQIPLNVFYSSMQLLFGRLMKYLPRKDTPVLAFGSDKIETGKSFVLSELSEILVTQKKKILWIDTISTFDKDVKKYLINDLLYNVKPFEKNKVFKFSNNIHKSYFLLDEDTFLKSLKTEDVESFIASIKGYDYIIWELFDVNYNMQLFSSIASATDLLVLVAGFMDSNRDQMIKDIEFLKDDTDIPITGILNNITKTYFNMKF